MDLNNKEKNNESSNIAPTDLRKVDIEIFGQENIPIMNMERKKDSNNYDAVNYREYKDIGENPPIDLKADTKKKKINFKNLLFILSLVLIIGAIGGGIYYFLSLTKDAAQNAVITKNIKISLGEKLSLKLDNYANFNNVNPANCILNIKDVDINTPGDYSYVISCGVNDYLGKVIVLDNIIPVVKTRAVIKKTGEDIKVGDFVESCEDYSDCQLEFKNYDDLKEKISVEGIYDVFIIAKDKQNNKVEVVEKLIVSDDNSMNILSCDYNSISSKKYKMNYVIKDVFILKNDYADNVINYAKYSFLDDEEFKSIKDLVDDNGYLTLENIYGKPYYNDSNKIVYIQNIDSVNSLSYLKSLHKEDIIDFYELMQYNCVLY